MAHSHATLPHNSHISLNSNLAASTPAPPKTTPQPAAYPVAGYNGGKAGNTKGFSGNMEGKLQGHKKDQRALELRKEGHSYESISEQLGYSTPSASYKAVMRRLRDMDRPAVSMLRELEVQRRSKGPQR